MYEIQHSARELLAEDFESSEFKVKIDVELVDDDPSPVHIYAEDILLNQQTTVDTH